MIPDSLVKCCTSPNTHYQCNKCKALDNESFYESVDGAPENEEYNDDVDGVHGISFGKDIKIIDTMPVGTKSFTVY